MQPTNAYLERTKGYLERTKGYLERFGHLIEHIEFKEYIFKELENEVFIFIADYCTQALKSMKILNVYLNAETISKSIANFANLTKLEMHNLLNWPKVLPLCANLEELELLVNYNFDYPATEFNFAFPKLRAFTVTVRYLKKQLKVQFSPILILFLQNNENLQSLSLSFDRNLAVPDIAKLTNLTELYLKVDASWDLQSLSDLSKLEKFKIEDCEGLNLGQFLIKSSSVETLQHLKVNDREMHEAFVNGLRRFHRLRYLSLNVDGHYGNVSDIVWTKLHQLNELYELIIDTRAHEVAEKFIKHLTGAHLSMRIISVRGGW